MKRQRAPRRGIPWAWITPEVERVLIIRNNTIVSRTNEVSKYGTPLWVDRTGRKHGYCGQIHVKPVFKYHQIFNKEKANETR